MYGFTRATTTLLAAGIAGLLVWVAAQLDYGAEGGYWEILGLMAAAGLVLAFAQLFGGWTRWGRPGVVVAVLAAAFLPVAVVTLWVILAGDPHHGWLHDHVAVWTRDVHLDRLVGDLRPFTRVLAFGAGVVLGLSLDPAHASPALAAEEAGAPERAVDDGAGASDPVAAERRHVRTG